MAAPVSGRMRQAVAERAAYRCEYGGLPQKFALHAHEPDHIVPHQHGGESQLQNLAWACLRCNRYKGPNVGSFDRSCTATLRIIPSPPKLGKMPPSQDMLEGATPWCRIILSLSSSCLHSFGSLSSCTSPGPSAR